MRSFVERYGLAGVLRDPKSLFGGGAPQPKLTPPPAMPDPMSPDALEARRKAIASMGQAGRQSTNLTTVANAGGTLAGGYSGSKLGANS